jgi:hypothetical protein
MQNAAWMTLLRQIPPNRHEIVVLVTCAGTEISMQNLVRLEENYAVVRGRLSGTTDTGRIFFIPYDQLNYLGFQKELKDADIHAIYGEREPEPAKVISSADNESPPPTQSEPPALDPAELRPQDPPQLDNSQDPLKTETRLSIPRRSRILERLRAHTERVGNSGPQSTL